MAGAVAQDIKRRVGGQLQAVRRHRGWSLRELAEASGLSLTTVHQIETGRTSPGLGTLQSLASALRVPLAALLDGRGPAAPAVHLPAGKRPGLAIPGGRLERLASGLASQRLRGLVLTLRPRREMGPAPIAHPGQELAVGLEGSCVFEVAGQRYSLKPGDSLLFDATRPHRALNPGPRPARILLVLYAPEEEPQWLEPHVVPTRPLAGGLARGREREARARRRLEKRKLRRRDPAARRSS
jgi:transcriptional regulator with XRE-family HTH domain